MRYNKQKIKISKKIARVGISEKCESSDIFLEARTTKWVIKLQEAEM